MTCRRFALASCLMMPLACSGEDDPGTNFISNSLGEESTEGAGEDAGESGQSGDGDAAGDGDGTSGDGDDASGDGDGTAGDGDGDGTAGDGDGDGSGGSVTAESGDGDAGDGDGTAGDGDGTSGDGDGTSGDGDGTSGDGDGTTGCVTDADCSPCQLCDGTNGMCVAAALDTDPKGDCGTCRNCDGFGGCRDLDCPDMTHTFQITSTAGGAFSSAAWQGGFETQVNAACSVTATFPTGNADLVGTLGDSFAVGAFTGYSFCDGAGGEDGDGCDVLSCPPLGIGSCEAGRPSCSAALNGTASAQYSVQCQGPLCICTSDVECGTCRTCQGSACVPAAFGTDPGGHCLTNSCDGNGNCSI